MFTTIFILFALFGTLFVIVDWWFPITLIPMVSMGLEITGIMLLWLGIIVFFGRVISTGAIYFVQLPDSRKTICIHQGKSGARILKGNKQEPNRIRALGRGHRGVKKWMNLKDTGDALNVIGHDVVVTSQDVGHNFPMWLVDYVDKLKNNWDFKNEKEFFELHDKIAKAKTHDDIFNIEELQPLFKDESKKALFKELELEDLKEMKMLIYDGRIINFKTYLDWSEGATPYDNEAIIDSDVSHRISQMQNFLKGGSGDMMKWIIIMFILVIIGIIAYQGFGG